MAFTGRAGTQEFGETCTVAAACFCIALPEVREIPDTGMPVGNLDCALLTLKQCDCKAHQKTMSACV
jgi:hypothetical protein